MVKGGTFNVPIKQTVDIPVMGQAGGNTQHILEYWSLYCPQNTEQFEDLTFGLNSSQFEDHERF